MNFPMDNPVFQYLYWLFNTPGIGGIVAGGLAGGVVLVFGLTLRWIARGANPREFEPHESPNQLAEGHERMR